MKVHFSTNLIAKFLATMVWLGHTFSWTKLGGSVSCGHWLPISISYFWTCDISFSFMAELANIYLAICKFIR